jgi:YVTN family beta-propeller protein
MTKRKGILLFTLSFIILFNSCKAQTHLSQPTGKAALPEHFRFIYNSDANNMFLGTPPMRPEKIYAYIDEVAKAGVTSFFISPNWGMPMNFPTKVGDMIGEHISEALEETVSKNQPLLNFRELLKSAPDPLALILNHAKARRMETFVSFRLNEVHDVESEESLIFDRFWRTHPEWHIGKAGDPMAQVYTDIMGPRTHPIVNSWLPAGLNFAVPEVRNYRMAQLREICERYDIDGLELDFQRFPMYFKPGEEERGIRIMSEWMREVRLMVEEAGKKRGRPILLAARILALPEQNKAIGLDPADWVHAGRVDFVIVSHYLHNNFQLPIEEYRSLFPRDFPVYASVEVEPGMDRFFNIVYPLWQKKVNGIYLFNYFFPGVKENATPPPYDSIRKLGYPIVVGDSVLLVANRHSNAVSYVNPKTFKVIKSIPTGPHPGGIVVTPDQKTAYISNFEPNHSPSGNKISVIDLVEGKQLKDISISYYGRLHGGAVSPDGRYVYFTSEYLGYVIEIETGSNRFVRAIPTQGREPHMVYVSPDGKYLLTANRSSGDISVIDRSTGCLHKKIPSGKGVEGMAFTPDRKFVWALNRAEGSITIIDMQKLEVTKTLECKGMPVRIRFTADGKRALVSGWTKEGTLTVIDVVTFREIKRIKVGNYAMGVELSADERYAFVGCEDLLEPGALPDVLGGSKKSKAESDGVHVIDMKTLKVVSVVKTGLGPGPMTMWYPFQ